MWHVTDQERLDKEGQPDPRDLFSEWENRADQAVPDFPKEGLPTNQTELRRHVALVDSTLLLFRPL
jgi:hypothetical protein